MFNVGDKLLHVQSILNFSDNHPLFEDVINTSFRDGYYVTESHKTCISFSIPNTQRIITLPAAVLGTLSVEYTAGDTAISGYVHIDTEKRLIHDMILSMTKAYIYDALDFMSKRTERLSAIHETLT